jgi:hypothetical protein
MLPQDDMVGVLVANGHCGMHLALSYDLPYGWMILVVIGWGCGNSHSLPEPNTAWSGCLHYFVGWVCSAPASVWPDVNRMDL